VPILRHPNWQSIQILTPDFDKYLEDAIVFMKENNNVDDFVGFYDFEIAKLERNLEILKERNVLNNADIDVSRKNFVNFFTQYDQRKQSDFLKTFPEMESFVNFCKSI
jgi:hypothetical protein